MAGARRDAFTSTATASLKYTIYFDGKLSQLREDSLMTSDLIFDLQLTQEEAFQYAKFYFFPKLKWRIFDGN